MEPKLRKRRKTTKFSLSAAGRLLGRRWQVSKQFLAAAQYWRRMVPSRDCDVVLTFPENAEEETMTWFLEQLRQRVPQLIVDVRHHVHSGSRGLYFTASYDSLLRGAEELKLRKLLKEEFGGGYREFSYEEQACFEGVDTAETFFSSQERQSIVFYLLNSLRAIRGESLLRVRFVEGQSIVQRCLSEGIVEQVLPLHDTEDLDKLRKGWVQAFFEYQPLDKICDYFGVKIAIYFAWLGHYTTALAVPAAVGFVLWIFCYGNGQGVEDACFVLFALMNVLWGTLYLESWKRYCAELAYHWGTLDSQSELLTEPRPLFTGPLGQSPVTGRLEPMYPAWKRHLFRYLVTVPAVSLCLTVVFMVMFLIFELQFQFVNSFLSLFYIAFYLQDMEKLKEQLAALLITRQVVGNVKESVVPFLTEHFNLARMGFSAATPTKRAASRRDASRVRDTREGEEDGPFLNGEDCDERRGREGRSTHLTQAEVECAMYKYEGTFEDYLEMFIQFGYVVLFSPAFPLAALCALLNNIVEVRSDAFKLCLIFQRPFGQRAENIGTWQDAMEVMGVIAVIVNCALIGTSGQMQRLFPSLTWGGVVVLIVVIEHIILLLKFTIAYAIPDIPEWVATEMAKIEYHRREAAKALQSAAMWRLDKRTSTVGLSTSDLPSSETQATATQTSPSCATEQGLPKGHPQEPQNPSEEHSEPAPSSLVVKRRSRASSLSSWASGLKSLASQQLRLRRITERARSAEGGRTLFGDDRTAKQASLPET